MLRFARRLPDLREKVNADLALDGMPRERVLAAAARLLELGFFRIGGQAYAEENATYGLAPLRTGHVKVRGDSLAFAYDSQSGQRRVREVAAPALREDGG